MSHDEEMADASAGAEINGEEIVVGKQRLTLVRFIRKIMAREDKLTGCSFVDPPTRLHRSHSKKKTIL